MDDQPRQPAARRLRPSAARRPAAPHPRPHREERLRKLLEYERSHADRLPVVEVVTARLRQLAGGATPSPGEPRAEPFPERPSPPRGGSPVTPQTAAEPSPPPRHGHPGHPGQPE
ncbi:hypothetical protein [Streptomyces violaceusniger]|uniref:hypothetical protein n=1 Tax=Streptomyces violaceusniger TaxID=68280 RepID=UPI00382E6E71